MGGVAAAGAASLPGAAAASGRLTTGDWEGTVRGLPASFRLIFDSQYVGTGVYAPYAFEDIVLLTPGNCSFSPVNDNAQVTAPGMPVPLRSSGSFGLNPLTYGFSGAVTRLRTARITARYVFPSFPGLPGCRGRLVWHLHPAHRVAVLDGTWKLRFSDGESEDVAVRGGGRLITGLSTPGRVLKCSGGGGTFNLFVHARGHAATDGSVDGMTIILSFKARHATGTLVSTSVGCGNLKLSIRGSLRKRAT